MRKILYLHGLDSYLHTDREEVLAPYGEILAPVFDYKNSPKVSDLKVAAQTSYIDLIIGGHTHTFLPRPTLVTNKRGNTTLVNQVGCYGINLGRVDFFFEEGSLVKNKAVTIEV